MSVGGASSASARVLSTLLVIDLVDSVALTVRLGDKRAARLFDAIDRAARIAMAARDGREIDRTDGFFVLFEESVAAVRFALDLQHALVEIGASEQVRLAARVGIHRDHVLLRHNQPADIARGAKPFEVEGLAKPLTARVAALAMPGQILLTDEAFRHAQESPLPESAADDIRWQAHGLYRLKGVEDPVSIVEVGHVGSAPLTAPGDVEKAHRVHDDNLVTGWRAAPGQTIPQRPEWRLERKLGEGGTGEVWLARHSSNGELRAFKFCYVLMRLRALRREVALFSLLQNALGQRSDIAQVRAWNFDEAPYYIEYDYVAGGDFGAWAQARGGLAQIPLALRLELVAQVADALAAAHAVGVLHKDVKPSNVLIEDNGTGSVQARLADFGIGEVDQDTRDRYGTGIRMTGLTEVLVRTAGSTAGTRMYMAPEQIEGQTATTHADAYALGVVLFQVVTGNFNQSLAPGWERQVDDELLRDDIASLVDGRPERRPANLATVAENLRALDTRRQSLDARHAEDLRNLRARRLRRILVPLFAVLLVIVGMLVWTVKRVSDEAQRATAEAATARAVSDFMIRMFSSADPQKTRGATLTVREVLDEGARSAQRDLASQPRVQAQLELTIGRAYNALGIPRQAKPILERSLAAQVRQHGYLSDEATEARHALMDTLDWLGEYKAEVALGKQELAANIERFGARSVPVARSLTRVGYAYNSWRYFSEAESYLLRAISIWQELAPQDPDHGTALYQLGANYLNTKRRDEALPMLERALATFRAQNGGLTTGAADLLENIAGIHRQAGNLDVAAKQFAEGQRIFDELGLRDSAGYSGVLFNNASIPFLRGDFNAALIDYQRSLALYRKNYPKAFWSYALTLRYVGQCLLYLDRPLEALPYFVEATQQYREMFNPRDNSEVARTLALEAVARAQTGERERAQHAMNEALQVAGDVMRRLPSETLSSEYFAEVAIYRARLFEILGERAAMRQSCIEALGVLGAYLDHRSIYNDSRRARLLLCAGRRDDAAPLLAGLDRMGYRDPYLGRWRDPARAPH